MEKVVADTVRIFDQIALRELPEEPNDQPEPLAVIVMNYDGVHPATLVDYLPPESQFDTTASSRGLPVCTLSGSAKSNGVAGVDQRGYFGLPADLGLSEIARFDLNPDAVPITSASRDECGRRSHEWIKHGVFHE